MALAFSRGRNALEHEALQHYEKEKGGLRVSAQASWEQQAVVCQRSHLHEQ